MQGAAIAIQALIDEGVDTIFGYPGGAVLPFYDELFKQNHIRHILVRHEQAAAHAAEAYARSTGKPGVILVTSGPGATNTVTGLTDALLDSIPIICITGQVPTHLIGTDAFQEADTVGITRACTKHNYLIKRTQDIVPIIKEAFHIASSGRPGPVVIDLPKDVQLQDAEYIKTEHVRSSYNPPFEADETAIREAIELMKTAKRPVFYTGGGVINAGDEASALLNRFVKRTGFPITSTLMGLGGFDGRDPQFLNMLGMHGSYEANMAMAKCDVMINIGARFDDRITGRIDAFSVDSKKIHVDVDASSINKIIPVDVPVVGDAAAVLKRFLAIWEAENITPDQTALDAWWQEIAGWREKKSFQYTQSGEVIKPQYALECLNEALHAQGDFYASTDVGQHQMWAAQFLQFSKPRRWMTSGGLGTMGYGLPAAVGAQIGNPDACVVCVSGEASILMNIQELATVAQYRLPVKLIILNNGYMGMVRQWQELFHGDRHSESYMEALPDFVALAESFGVRGMRQTDPAKVKETIAEFLTHDGPVLLDMVVDQTENVYPMIPAGAAHYDMKLNPETVVEVDETLSKSQV